MDYFRECGVIESILAELIGSFTICGILLSGTTLTPLTEYIQDDDGNITPSNHSLNRKLGIAGVKIGEEALAQGLVVASAVEYTISISGGHLNPAITLGALICRYIRVIPGLCYILAQIIGALIGQVAAGVIKNKPEKDVPEFDAASAFIHGVIASFTLVSVFLSVSDPRIFTTDVGSAPLAIGVAVVAAGCCVTDCRTLTNPAMSLASSVHYEHFQQDWVYWIAPLVGGSLAGLVYRLLTSYGAPSFVRIIREPPFVTVTTSSNKE